MKTLSLVTAAAVFAAAVNLASAAAAEPQASNANQAQTVGSSATGAPYYEWQYHYAGHHPRWQGHWVLVR